MRGCRGEHALLRSGFIYSSDVVEFSGICTQSGSFQMQKVRDEDYDSCGRLKKYLYYTKDVIFCWSGKSLVRKKWSDQADETMGDYLCGQVHYFHFILNKYHVNFPSLKLSNINRSFKFP